MKTASLDLGSNSFLCLISEIQADGTLLVLEDVSVITRLGQGLQQEGKLTNEALLRAAQTFQKFKEIMDRHNVSQVKAVTTAAAREASNFEALKALGLKYGIPIDLISGEEEALMSFEGAIAQAELKSSLLLDIGGGSTEMAYYPDDKEKLFLRSLPLGSVRLGEMFVSDWAEVDARVVAKVKDQILKALDVSWGQARPPIKNWVAVAGTPTTLQAVEAGGYSEEAVNGQVLTYAKICNLNERILSLPLSERRKLAGMAPKRADVIPIGGAILQTLMEWADVSEVKVSTRGLRYGLAKKHTVGS